MASNIFSSSDCRFIEAAEPVELVNHPAHYGGDSAFECIKVLEAWLSPAEFVGWLKGTIIKYLCRLGKKDDPAQDAAKAAWYAAYLNEFLKRQKAAQNSESGIPNGSIPNDKRG